MIDSSVDAKNADVPNKAILVINCGSSSVKFALIGMRREELMITGLVERIGSADTCLSWREGDRKNKKALPDAGLVESLSEVLSVLPEDAQIVAIGHRVVHGGEAFFGSVLISEEVMAELERCSALAPLHNPANLAGVRAAQKVFPNLPQVGVFDTAFHQTLPKHAYFYAVPYDWYTEHGVRRYGFHGTSHRYVSEEAARCLGKKISDVSLVVAHLGNGCSACAVEGGKSVDTTMGISPLEGLVMGTRSGDVDPALHEFIAKAKGWSLERIMKALNKESGLLGLSGESNDMRTLVEGAGKGDARAELAIDVFCYRLAKAIMGLTAALSRLDAIVFTGGIGENASEIRAQVISHLKVLGVAIDADLNSKNGEEVTGRITTEESVPALVVATNEELMIARETLSIIDQ
ncbi:MAG: acetate kinase [Verrucomicrobiota bacterium]